MVLMCSLFRGSGGRVAICIRLYYPTTVEPPNKGHIGLSRKSVLFSEDPSSEVPLYISSRNIYIYANLTQVRRCICPKRIYLIVAYHSEGIDRVEKKRDQTSSLTTI